MTYITKLMVITHNHMLQGTLNHTLVVKTPWYPILVRDHWHHVLKDERKAFIRKFSTIRSTILLIGSPFVKKNCLKKIMYDSIKVESSKCKRPNPNGKSSL